MKGPYCAICGDPIFRQKTPHGVPYGRWHHLTRNQDRTIHKAQAKEDTK